MAGESMLLPGPSTAPSTLASVLGDEEEGQDFASRVGEFLGKLLVVPVLLALFVIAGYAVGDALLADSPEPADPGYVDSVLASGAVVAGIRIAIIFAAIYVVVSVVALIARRQWLTKVGPIEASEQVTEALRENQALRDQLESAGDTIRDLEDELRDTNELLGIVAGMVADDDEEDE